MICITFTEPLTCITSICVISRKDLTSGLSLSSPHFSFSLVTTHGYFSVCGTTYEIYTR